MEQLMPNLPGGNEMKTCNICGSLLLDVDGKETCSNPKCGTGNHVKWCEDEKHRLENALIKGYPNLITAKKEFREPDLGGFTIGLGRRG